MEEVKHEKCGRCKCWRLPNEFLNESGRKLKTCNKCREGRNNNNKKLTIEECKEFAISKGGLSLSNEYINAHTKMKWKCSEDHEWYSNFNNIKSGKWCPNCAFKINADNQRGNIEECKEFAKTKNGECIDTTYVNSYTKLKWRCSENHEWYQIFNHVKRGVWCPECNGNKKLTIEECKEFALSKNGICLSDLYKNCDTKLRWKCSENHEWEARFGNIKTGTWCPQCSGYKSEEMCRDIFEKYLLEKFPKKKPKWLEGLELDGYNEDLNMAFEYNGRQHYEYNERFHRGDIENFEKQKERDIKKYRICREKKINLIIIPHQYDYQKPEELDAFIYDKLCDIC